MITKDLHSQTVANFIDFDLENDKELLEIVELASAVTESPFVIISLVDGQTVHFKVRKGVSNTSLPYHLSFCTHAILQKELIIIPDTLLDERFASNALVTGGPQLRFYAAMPLIGQSGDILGTLCVTDIKPKTLDHHQQLVLKILSNQVMKILELREGMEMLRKNQAELEAQKQLNNEANIKLRSFFESSTNFHVLLGKHGEVIDFNKTAVNFIKAVHKAKLVKGDQFMKYLDPEFVSTFITQYNLALQGTKSFKEGSTLYDEMGVIWWEAAFEAARDTDNNIIGVSYLIRNVTERKIKEQKILTQNASLLKIAHIQAHEFRAPLTSIMGLMGLIKEDYYSAPKEYIQLLEQAVDALDTTIRHIVKDIDASVIQQHELQSS
jgi:PAS domain S-box-containing protein